MNTDTANLLTRPYQEIVNDILTAIVGGVVNEPIFFDLKQDHYPLAKPALDIRAINGTATPPGTQQSMQYAFQKTVDFVYSQGDNAVAWLPGGVHPDDATTFYVDYFQPNSTSPLTDINVGSVTRTLGEAISREIAIVYQQINQAYLSGFVDTATGKTLDLVVSILDVTRKTKVFAIGLVTFFRDQSLPDGNITIPEGTLLSTTKGDATFVTDELRALQQGQIRIDVPVRASDASKGQVGVVPAGAITTLAQAITGISRVTNFDATVLGSNDETDDQLRARAKALLRGVGKGTLAALIQIVFEEGAAVNEIWDPEGSPPKTSPPGTVILQIQTEPERFLNIQSAVQETRAAGIQATLVAKYIFFKPRLVITIASGLIPTAAGKVKLINQVIAAMQTYVDGLQLGQPVQGGDLIQAIIKGGIKEVSDAKQIRIADVVVSRADINQPGVETLVDALVDAITAAGPLKENDALKTVLNNVINTSAPAPPTSTRIPDRDLLQGPGGQRATDVEIEAGQFTISPLVSPQIDPEQKPWQFVLDIVPTDIALLEKS